MSGVLVEDDGAVRLLTIDRPEVRNAIDGSVLDGIEAGILNRPPDTRVVLVTGSGGNFSAGADIAGALAIDDEAGARAFVRRFRNVFDLVARAEVPVIAAIEGWAMGGGLELALACDIRVASTDARLGVPEARIGALAAAGGTYRLRRLAGESMARFMLLTGLPITGERAATLGMVSEVCSPGMALTRASKLAAQMTGLAPLAVRAAKQILSDPLEATEADRAEEINAALFLSADRHEGMAAFLEKRPPRFEGR